MTALKQIIISILIRCDPFVAYHRLLRRGREVFNGPALLAAICILIMHDVVL
jgi:hypothetical protein